MSLLLVAGSASAKEFPPGALKVCGATQCRVVTDAQSGAFSSLLWGDRPVTRAPTPPVGSAIFQLRFRDGPAGAIVSAPRFASMASTVDAFSAGSGTDSPPR